MLFVLFNGVQIGGTIESVLSTGVAVFASPPSLPRTERQQNCRNVTPSPHRIFTTVFCFTSKMTMQLHTLLKQLCNKPTCPNSFMSPTVKTQPPFYYRMDRIAMRPGLTFCCSI